MADWIIYRGTSKDSAQKLVARQKSFAASGNGEFGAGIYFWDNDLAAAMVSALQYHGDKEWAVLKVTIPDAVRNVKATNAKPGYNIVDFPSLTGGGGSLVWHETWLENQIPDSANQVATGKTPGTFNTIPRKMTVQQFRKINQYPDRYGITDESNKILWERYWWIRGQCAADYQDETLIQVKFYGEGVTMLNQQNVAREIVLSGPILTATQKGLVGNWKMKNRAHLLDIYLTEDGTSINVTA